MKTTTKATIWLLVLATNFACARQEPFASPVYKGKDRCVSTATTDAEAEQEIKACFDEYNRLIIEERGSPSYRAFRRNYYWTDDPKQLSFLERRQLEGGPAIAGYFRLDNPDEAPWSPPERKFSIDLRNLWVRAKGDVAVLAANAALSVVEPDGSKETDDMRLTEVFERIDDIWRVTHIHTSFQAEPGPQRPVPLQNNPTASLWDGVIQGSWREAGGGRMVASRGVVSITGVKGLPAWADYVIEPGAESMVLKPIDGGAELEVVIEHFTSKEIRFRTQDESNHWSWSRVDW